MTAATSIWSVMRHQPSGEAYAMLTNEGVITEIVGPLATNEHTAAWAGDCAGNGSADDLEWATAQQWRQCECEQCTAAWAASEHNQG